MTGFRTRDRPDDDYRARPQFAFDDGRAQVVRPHALGTAADVSPTYVPRPAPKRVQSASGHQHGPSEYLSGLQVGQHPAGRREVEGLDMCANPAGLGERERSQ